MTGTWVQIRRLLAVGERDASVLLLSDCCDDVGKLAFKVALEEAAESKRVLVADLWSESGFGTVVSRCTTHCDDEVKRLLQCIVFTSSKSAFEDIMTASVCRDVARAASDGPLFDVVVTTSMHIGAVRDMLTGVSRPQGCTFVAVAEDHLRIATRGPVSQRVDAIVKAEREGCNVTLSIIKNRFGPHGTFRMADDPDGICLVDEDASGGTSSTSPGSQA